MTDPQYTPSTPLPILCLPFRLEIRLLGKIFDNGQWLP